MSYLNISAVAKCSHGSVSAERAAMKREEAELKRSQDEKALAEQEIQQLIVSLPDLSSSESSPVRLI